MENKTKLNGNITNMDKDQDSPKKCFCARCFLPIEPEDKVDIDGQNFHRICSMCCICRTIPTSLKMFYGHVFCTECFKNHVLSRFRGENPRMHSNSWWMQWAPGTKPPQQQHEKAEKSDQDEKEKDEKENEETCKGENKSEPTKKCICARCLQVVDEAHKIDIGGQSFHPQCCRCYFCHCVPKDSVKIYYGQVFCEDCFHRHVLNRNRDNPSEFFRNCFDQWQNNTQFAESMRQFMAGSDRAPFIFMMQQQQAAHPQFCRCGTNPQNPNPEWFQTSEPKKSATPTPANPSVGGESIGTFDLSFENRTEASDNPESYESANQENLIVAAAEKIEKLTKYLHENSDSEKCSKKWKNFIDYDKSSMASEWEPSCFEWVDLQDPKLLKNDNKLVCPKCLWQCGSIFVNSDYFQKDKCYGDYNNLNIKTWCH